MFRSTNKVMFCILLFPAVLLLGRVVYYSFYNDIFYMLSNTIPTGFCGILFVVVIAWLLSDRDWIALNTIGMLIYSSFGCFLLYYYSTFPYPPSKRETAVSIGFIAMGVLSFLFQVFYRFCRKLKLKRKKDAI